MELLYVGTQSECHLNAIFWRFSQEVQLVEGPEVDSDQAVVIVHFFLLETSKK